MNTIKKIISINLRKLMEYNGLSATELAELSGVTQRTISSILDYKSSGSTVSVNTLNTLAGYLKIKIYYFFIEDMTPEMMMSDDFKDLIECYIKAPIKVQKKTLRTCLVKTKYFADRQHVGQDRQDDQD